MVFSLAEVNEMFFLGRILSIPKGPCSVHGEAVA